MPPHCDTLDGPVVNAARNALNKKDVGLVLPYAPQAAEDEIMAAFEKCVNVRELGDQAKEVADRFFFETVVRLHRAGENEPFSGLKPAGLDTGPVIPVAEEAIESRNDEKLIALLCEKVGEEVHERFTHMIKLAEHQNENVDGARNYVTAMLHVQVYSHKLYKFAEDGPTHG